MEPLKIELTLDIDRHLARFHGYDEDGEPNEGPTTAEELIVELAANAVAATVTKSPKWDGHRERVQTIRDEVIREKLTPLIEQALAASIQPTDPYGQPKGAPTTLTEIIVKTATDLLTKEVPSGRYPNERRRPMVAAWVEEAVDRTIKAELSKELDAARAEVRAAVRQQGAQVIAETIERMASR